MDNDKIIERIEDKVDRMGERLSSIDATLMLQHASLKEHIKRTKMLEDRLEPIEERENKIKSTIGLIVMVSGAVGFIAAIAEIASYLCK